ncbi:hypothetical protein AWB69_09274 [Caballeronia udeis]|uniref:Uncharacterized protein n=1 Tax=Caballeronia udeis TaxID=1232866 RepID=A0A158K3J9_9BURK|nr:hypothetical protein AWB69_09274 [Caballeronia udeis]
MTELIGEASKAQQPPRVTLQGKAESPPVFEVVLDQRDHSGGGLHVSLPGQGKATAVSLGRSTLT